MVNNTARGFRSALVGRFRVVYISIFVVHFPLLFDRCWAGTRPFGLTSAKGQVGLEFWVRDNYYLLSVCQSLE